MKISVMEDWAKTSLGSCLSINYKLKLKYILVKNMQLDFNLSSAGIFFSLFEILVICKNLNL